MKTLKTILFVALLIFHIATVIVISIGKNDLNFLFDLFKQMDLVQYSAIVGLILFLIVIFLFQRQEKAKAKLVEKHENEINQIKAKLYDKKESESNTKNVIEEKAEQNKTDSSSKNDSHSTESDQPKNQS